MCARFHEMVNCVRDPAGSDDTRGDALVPGARGDSAAAEEGVDAGDRHVVCGLHHGRAGADAKGQLLGRLEARAPLSRRQLLSSLAQAQQKEGMSPLHLENGASKS